ncbi:ervatamin-B [Selaginella moellendorffii]|uniref:ervatamin-B n=1 Tax=Selaginella moellendorffii TaxID=88036 RepID=UPI000D1CE31E|nr:ervatamin-B [Selaginella moellendorffii]|eukprot:XP_024525848.1 ervatamin-B [Selaginella moellendorffii]
MIRTHRNFGYLSSIWVRVILVIHMSCWAFSAIASIESAHFLATKQLVSLDTVDEGCKGGLSENEFQFVVGNGGVTTEETYPYTGFAGSCNANRLRFAGSRIGYGIKGGMPSWIIKNTSWGEDGFMKFEQKDGDGMCGMDGDSSYPTTSVL